MAFDPNPLFFEMCSIYANNYTEDNKVIICNEGGSRSSKTWDAFHFIYAFCDHNRGKENDIYILRDTLTNCRDYTFKDFKKCMKVIGANLKYSAAGQKPYVNIFGNHVYFRGLDSEENTEGYPSDIIFINEALETQKSKVDGLKMRCRKLMIMDWNPKYTQHWCFDMEYQDNVFFTNTTYKNNKHLQGSVISEIESYEPWESGTYEIIENDIYYNGSIVDEKNQPPPHSKNVFSTTADEFRWKVYGLGLRGAMQGVIFKNITWIDEFPDLAHTYGMDFGFVSDPLAFGKYAREGRNIYLELLIYTPISTALEVDASLRALGVSQYVPITADSSDKYVSEKKGTVQMVRELYEMGWEISKVSKTKGVMFWLEDMKNYKIHIVKSSNNKLYKAVKTERENYAYKEINGIQINQPIDKFNHFWDACFTGNTLITTIKGETPIKNITKGELVLTSTGFRQVLDRWDNGIKETYEYCLQFDTFCLYLQSTKDHKIKTDNGWIEISKLEQGATVYLAKSLTAKHTDYTKERSISQEQTEKCTGTYGSSIKESAEKVMTSITQTKKEAITGLKILKKSKLISTVHNTLSKGLKTIQNGLKSSTQRELQPQKNGISQRKVSNGISNTQRILDSGHLPLEMQIAKDVTPYSSGKQQIMSSAQIDVSQRGEDYRDSITSQEHVNTVVMSGHATSIQKLDAVQKCVLVRIDSKPMGNNHVYDLHVEGVHEYFANGLLVHNCRYSHMSHDFNSFSVTTN